jgi:hypothetical protein
MKGSKSEYGIEDSSSELDGKNLMQKAKTQDTIANDDKKL